VKLKYLPKILKRREEIAERYKVLKKIKDIGTPIHQEGRVWQDYCLEVDNPLGLREHLKSKGIETLGVNMVPPHKALNLGVSLPHTERLYRRLIRIPMNETLLDSHIDYVIRCIEDFYD